MFTLDGKYNDCKVFADTVDNATISQIINVLNQESSKDSQIRIMPDCHAAKASVVGTTMTIKDKIVPNLVGADIGCLDKDTEILTPNGWIKISDYNNEEILIYDKLNEYAKFEKPLAYIKLPCDNFYYFHHSKGLDQMLSNEHKMLIWKGYPKKGYIQEIKLAEDFYNSIQQKEKVDYYGTKTTFSFINEKLGYSENFIRILIMVSADGRVRYNKNKTRTYVELHFKKERKIERADYLLTKENIKYNKKMANDGTTFISFTLDMYFDKNLRMFYKASSEELAILCNEVYFWDGTIDEKRNHKVYSSTNKENIDVIQFALATQNIRAGIRTIIPSNPKWNTQYSTYETQNQIVSYKKDDISIIKSVDGYKYCFTTSTGFFIIRRNNCISITGNCGVSAVKISGKIEFEKLDKFIKFEIPSGASINKHAVEKFDELKNLVCPVNIEQAYLYIGSLGGGEVIATDIVNSDM